MTKPKFIPSPMAAVKFPDGKIVYMNRATRRRNKLYGKNVTKVGGSDA